jgi:HEAT repeat protein
MPKKQFEEQLEVLDRLREAGATPETTEALRKALRHRSNYYVAKAARVAAEINLSALAPDLLVSLERFFVDPVKSDPQCWAKNAIVQALSDLGHAESATYLRGLHHVQMEPVWGGQADSAAPLRARCALALVQCRDLNDTQVLSHLIEILVDADKTVRVEAARAIGRIDRPESALLLRLRALTGDPEPEVLGACFSALLQIGEAQGIPFVTRFLDREEEVAGEAALALGLTHDAAALKILKDQWERKHDPVVLTAIALTNLAEALDFLIDQVAADSLAALEALSSARLTPEVRARIEGAVESTGNPRLRAAFEKRFPR